MSSLVRGPFGLDNKAIFRVNAVAGGQGGFDAQKDRKGQRDNDDD